MRKILTVCFFVLLFSPFFAHEVNNSKIHEARNGTLYDYRDTLFEFSDGQFYARLSHDYEKIKLKYISKMVNKEIYLNCDSYIEQLTIRKINSDTFWFSCEALGFQQFFIWDLPSDRIYEPFFDMKQKVYISIIDYKNQVLFGDSTNSDKGVMQDQKVELFLFSTYKQKNYKIAEKKGKSFNVKLLDNNIIQYDDGNNELIQFDYSDWIIQPALYSVSSFLVEGKSVYAANNLSKIDGLPWASANGFGINDKILIETGNQGIQELLLYNGFQSSTRLDLYKANSRVKKILVKNLQTQKAKEVLLMDTKEAQIIPIVDLDTKNNSKINLEITILDIYPGEKYKDLCIQAIIPSY